MNPIVVVILLELYEFSLKVLSIPKEDVIKVFTTNGVLVHRIFVPSNLVVAF